MIQSPTSPTRNTATVFPEYPASCLSSGRAVISKALVALVDSGRTILLAQVSFLNRHFAKPVVLLIFCGFLCGLAILIDFLGFGQSSNTGFGASTANTGGGLFGAANNNTSTNTGFGGTYNTRLLACFKFPCSSLYARAFVRHRSINPLRILYQPLRTV